MARNRFTDSPIPRTPPGTFIIYETGPDGDSVLERFSQEDRGLAFVKRYRDTFHPGAHIRGRRWVEQVIEVD